MPTKSTAVEQSINIPALNIKQAELPIVGISPLIVHRWSEKAKREMLEKQMKRAKVAKAAKDPEEDYEQSLYKLPGGGFGFPAVGFKAAAITAVTQISGLTKVLARGAFHVRGIQTDEGEMVRIEGEPRIREDMVRIAMGTADIRYRGEFPKWSAVLDIRYNANVISPEQIANLFHHAGFAVGVGEWRPEKDGQYGMFEVGDGR